MKIHLVCLICSKQETELGAGASYAGDAEILDEAFTRSRGEFKHVSSPKITSTTSTPGNAHKSLESPRVSCSPRISELRGVPSPRSGGRGPHSPKTGEVKPSILGKSPSSNTTS